MDTPAGGGVAVTPNCTGKAGQGCCYFQSKADISGRGTTPLFDCWEKGGLPPAPPPTPVPPPWAGPHSCCCASCTLPPECHGMGGAGVTTACPSMMWRDPKVAHGFFTASRSTGSFYYCANCNSRISQPTFPHSTVTVGLRGGLCFERNRESGGATLVARLCGDGRHDGGAPQLHRSGVCIWGHHPAAEHQRTRSAQLILLLELFRSTQGCACTECAGKSAQVELRQFRYDGLMPPVESGVF